VVELCDLTQWFLRTQNMRTSCSTASTGWTGWPEKVRTCSATGRPQRRRAGDFAVSESAEIISVFTTRIDTTSAHQRAACAGARRGEELCRRQSRAVSADRRDAGQQKAAREGGDLGAIEKHGSIPAIRNQSPSISNFADLGCKLHFGRLRNRRHHERTAHDDARLRFANKYGPSRAPRNCSHQVTNDSAAAPVSRRRRLLRWRFRPMDGTILRRSAATDAAFAKKNWIWHCNGYISSEGLGRQPPALLGHAASPWSTAPMATRNRAGWRWSAARERASPCCFPPQVEITQQGGSPLARVAEFVNTAAPVCRWPGPPRDRHHGHLVDPVALTASPTRRNAVCVPRSDEGVHGVGSRGGFRPPRPGGRC